MFFRIHSDGTRTPVDLRGHFAGPSRSTCWIIGGGPSLAELPCDRIERSPVPRLAVNLCGFGLLRPTIWTAYDPTVRFHRSTYLDASILKLLPARRATDLVPETTHKVGDCPNTLFFERDGQRGFHNFPRGEQPADDVTDWQDSLVQAIDLAWKLGFRRLLLAGCDMFVQPPEDHRNLAASLGVLYQPEEPLRDFYDRCRNAGLDPQDLEKREPIQPYHFEETKSLAAALQTDFHYFRIVQYLRLSRRAMALAGLELVSATPSSRLNAFFPYRPCDGLLAEIADEVGDPARESTRGQYGRRHDATIHVTAGMKDFRPHNWSRPTSTHPRCQPSHRRTERLAEAVDRLPEIEVRVREEG